MKKIGIIIGILIILGVAYWLLSPLWTTRTLNEKVPEGNNVEEMQSASAQEVLGTQGHPASGSVRVITIDENTYLRYEEFETINGPDLFVYLSNDLEANDSINIGALKATEGNINYEIPQDVNIEDYRYALVWCRAFGVLFNYAEI